MRAFALRSAIALFLAGPLLSAASLPAEIDLVQKIRSLESRSIQSVDRWEAAERLTLKQALNPKFRPKRSQPAAPGLFWNGPRTVWLRSVLVLPERVLGIPVAGSAVSLAFDIQDEGEVYIDGMRRSSFARLSGEIELTRDIRPGRRIFIALKIVNKKTPKGLFTAARLSYSALAETERRLQGAYLTARVVSELGPALPVAPALREACLRSASAAIDGDALFQGRTGDFFRSLDASRDALMPLSPALKSFRFFLLAYSHMDLAWLWTKDEGEHVVWKRTAENMLETLARHPEITYAASQMHAYRWMERDYPPLFARIQQAVRAGRWEPVGAEWVESDGNIPSGESFVRQFLYGREYSLAKLGRTSTLAFLPDTFGFNAQLPQILAKCDLRGLVAWRIVRSDAAPFPDNLFWWQSADGSRVLVDVLAGRYDETVRADEMAAELALMNARHGAKDDLVVFGRGDHGSGIPEDYLERASALQKDPLFPRVEYASAETAFDAFEKRNAARPFPLRRDELYLNFFRGVYTAQAQAKDNNRRNEHRLGNAEKFSAAAALAVGRPYPGEALEEAWKDLLFNQFHDILPGTSVAGVYRDERLDSARVAAEADRRLAEAQAALAASADTSGPGLPVVLFNGLSWARGGLVEWPLPAGAAAASVTDERGREVPSQIVRAENGAPAAAFVAGTVPAVGYAVYRVLPGIPASAPAAGLSVKGTTIENEFLRVTIDPGTGWVAEIRDKRSGRSVVAKGRQAFELQAYQEIFGSNAYTPIFQKDPMGLMPPEGSRFPLPPPGRVWVEESGPVRATVTAERTFRSTVFRTRISLVRGIPIVFGAVDADWQERNVFLKCAFPLALEADRAAYEIPYGVLDRGARPGNAEDAGKWEVCGHRWADLTDRGGGFGATLLSFSKYGFDARDNTLRMSLLHGSGVPDPNAERGRHHIPLALFPHAGGWETAGSTRAGAEYNDPLLPIAAAPHPGASGRSRSFFACGPANVHLTAVKKAEDGEGWIVRVVNWGRRREAAVLRLPAAPGRIRETNLVERDLRVPPPAPAEEIRFSIGPQEIKTFRLVF